NLLDPWPLKIVLDNVLRSQSVHGWVSRFILSTLGENRLAILKFAVVGVFLIAVAGALCSYAEKYLTTSVGQWVMHDLRRTLYSHIQRLSLAYHDQKQTGDLISRVTSDIDAIQSFIASGLLGVLVDCLTLLGMVMVMFYINWRFTLVALSVAPVLFGIIYSYILARMGVTVASMEMRFSFLRLVRAKVSSTAQSFPPRPWRILQLRPADILPRGTHHEFARARVGPGVARSTERGR